MPALYLAAVAVVLQQVSTRTVEIRSDAPAAVTVEHLTIDTDGKAHVTDQQHLSVGAPLVLTYESGEGRYVRFSYEGVSPRTYAAAELSALTRLRLPDALPGGELLLIVPPAAVRPGAFEITGPRVRTLHAGDAGHLSLPGLPAGSYRVVPVYDGGIKGRARAYDVQTARTSIGAIPVEAVGAARVIAARPVCDVATEVQVDMRLPAALRDDGRATPPHRAHVATSDEPRCDMTFAGLPPGSFQISYRNIEGTIAGAVFDVESQRVTDVSVESPPVRVSGRVTLNGRPMPGVALRFLSRGGTDRAAGAIKVTRTDGSGYFTVALESAGTYSIHGSSDEGILGHMEPAAFVVGSNTLDIPLAGGTLSVELTGWDRRAAVNVTVKGPDGALGTSFRPDDSTGRRRFFGLPFGPYTVTLQLGPARAQEIVLTPSRPEATVKFDLVRR